MNFLQEILGMFSIKRLAVWFSIFLFCFLLRGGLFRWLFTYKAEKRYVLEYKIEDAQLIKFILEHPEIYDRDLQDMRQVAIIAEKITADVLYFEKESTITNSNLIFKNGGAANDAGYSAFYATVCEYLIDYYNLKKRFDCRHIVGSCFFRKTNLSTFQTLTGKRPFASEFHFNVIIDLKTGETITLDPSLYDGYRISTVSSNYIVAIH